MKIGIKYQLLLLVIWLQVGQLQAQTDEGTAAVENETETSSAHLATSLVDSFGEDKMVYIAGGTFTMGCSRTQSDCDFDAIPKHQLTISSFYMGKYEVTQQEWELIMGTNPSDHKGCPNCPVEMVDWEDAEAYCKALSAKTGKVYRLPTEAEWEYAARGGNSSNNYQYGGSDSLSQVGWFYDNSGGKTQEVGKKKANELGLYDMTGNVFEWCSDWYDDEYYKTSPSSNPLGPSSGASRILRGGAWMSFVFDCGISYRGKGNPGRKLSFVGFRVVCVP